VETAAAADGTSCPTSERRLHDPTNAVIAELAMSHIQLQHGESV
jgi:hypothetical protein